MAAAQLLRALLREWQAVACERFAASHVTRKRGAGGCATQPTTGVRQGLQHGIGLLQAPDAVLQIAAAGVDRKRCAVHAV